MEIDNNYKLELIQVLFRHGARTPIIEELSSYDYVDESVYKHFGLGALTNKGKKEVYDLGCFLRKRYNDFLSADPGPEDVYARSTYSSRTKVSLQLVLAGLYPPTDHAVWNEDLKWSPLPYEYAPHELDILLRPFDRPEYLKIMAEAQKAEKFQKRVAKFSSFFEKLDKITNKHFGNNLLYVLMVSGLIFSNEHMGLPLPDWYTPDMKQTFRDIRQCFFDCFALTTDMKKFGIGPLMRTFIENMNVAGKVLNPRKIYLYSAHDDNVAAFVRAHGIRDHFYPEFGSSLIIEKWRDNTNKIFIKLLAWSPGGKLTTLKFGRHIELYPIDDYLKLIRPLIPTDDELDNFFRDVHYKDLKKTLFYDWAIKRLP